MITPTIHFQGNCKEAIDFYIEVFGAQVKAIHYAKDAPSGNGMDKFPPEFVMHSEVTICGTDFSLTDGAELPISGHNFSFLIRYKSPDELISVFNKLAAGGKIVESPAPQFWTPLWGYVVDKFGVNWSLMVDV
ncbi:MAG: VOC family protein [Elusimicrobia bacterium]|nr:VOC family protein [Elusimicrobiota bacterium]